MKLKARPFNLEAGGKPIVIMNADDVEALGLQALERVKVKNDGKEIVAIIDVAKSIVHQGEIVTTNQVNSYLNVKRGQTLWVSHEKDPESLSFIKKKLNGGRLDAGELKEIVKDTVNGDLSDIELASFITALHILGMSMEETEYFTRAMISNGKKLGLKGTIVDKHCLPADTSTIVRNGGNIKVENIGAIIDNIFERCKPDEIYNDGEAEFTGKNLNNLQAMAHDDNGNVDFVPVSAVYRLKSPEHLTEVTLLGNRKIKTTDNHTVFVLKDGRIQNIVMQDIKKGDYVLVPTKIKKGETIKDISLKTDFFREHHHKRIKEKIEITREFMRLLGYYISEGFTNSQGIFLNFGSHEKELIEDAKKCVETVFGINCTINKPHDTARRVSVYSQMTADIFEKIIKAGSSALEKQIPSFVFDVEDEMKLEFLRALFKGDGYRRRGYEAIYVTSSKKLATDLQYFLSLMGISVALSEKEEGERQFPNQKKKSFIQKSYYIYTQAREIFGERKKDNVAFINLLPIKELGEIETDAIGWEFRRELKRQKYMTKQKLKRIEKFIKSGDIKKIINGSISVLKVKNVRSVKSTSKHVYDFRVDGYNRFVAGTAPICIHNSIGGIPGDKTSLIAVPIIAAAGLVIPKTSSRAITSPAGTADRMEVLAPVNHTIDDIKKIVRKTGGCLVWGGALDLAPADDVFIKIEFPLRIDPMLLPSILSKKKAVGANFVVIDIPTGSGAKIKTMEDARELSEEFVNLGKRLDMKISCGTTFGEEPLGRAIGPALEAREALQTLMGKGPADVVEKTSIIVGILFEMVGKGGARDALRILKSGKAEKKFRQIIAEQGGNPKIKPSDICIGEKTADIVAEKSGRVLRIKNPEIAAIAKEAGAPKDKCAGIFLHKKMGEKVSRGEKLFTIYSKNSFDLKAALKLAKETKPFIIGKEFEEKMLLDEYPAKMLHKKAFLLER